MSSLRYNNSVTIERLWAVNNPLKGIPGSNKKQLHTILMHWDSMRYHVTVALVGYIRVILEYNHCRHSNMWGIDTKLSNEKVVASDQERKSRMGKSKKPMPCVSNFHLDYDYPTQRGPTWDDFQNVLPSFPSDLKPISGRETDKGLSHVEMHQRLWEKKFRVKKGCSIRKDWQYQIANRWEGSMDFDTTTSTWRWCNRTRAA